MIREDAIPRLRPGHWLRHDHVRDRWLLMAPERLFELDESAAQILGLVDEQRSIATIIDQLAGQYEASREEIARDVVALFSMLSDRLAVQL